MTSDSGLTNQDSDSARQIQETLDELQHMQATLRLVTSPEELEALEREIRQCTDRLGSFWWAITFKRAWIQQICNKWSKTCW